MDAVAYIHGKNGSAEESEHYRSLFPSCKVIGIDYKGFTPWEVGREIREEIAKLRANYNRVTLIANSIGAYFSMNADIEKSIVHAYFVSPIVDMEQLIINMMVWAGVTESELQKKGVIHTDFGEDLSWEYLCYVRKHPVSWNVPTDILYGNGDHLTSIDTITAFVQKHHAILSVMENGEHWFHTDVQMQFLDNWLKRKIGWLA